MRRVIINGEPVADGHAVLIEGRCVACGAAWRGDPDTWCAIGTGHVAATVTAVTMSDGGRYLVRHVPQTVEVAPL